MRIGDLAARAVHLLARRLPLLPLARHPRRHAPRRERERERVARARHAARCAAIAPLLVPPTGQAARRDARARARPRAPLRALRRGRRRRRSPCSPTRDVPVAHCPRSNALLGCGIAPLTRAARAGVRVGLGTDSPASTPSFDMFEELRGGDLRGPRPRAARRRAAAAEALALATIDAARALRLDAEVGTLTPGKRADLTVVSLAGSPYHPVEDPAAAVVFGGSPDRVLETIVDGQTRYRKAEETAVARGTQHRKRRPGPNARKPATAPSVAATAEAAAARVAGAAVLPAAARPRQVGVRAPRARLRARLRLPRRRLRLERDHRRAPERLQLRQGGRRHVDLEPREEDAEEPAGRDRRGATSRPPTRRSSARTTRSSRSRSTPACARRTRTRSPSSRPSTPSRRSQYATDYQTPSRPPRSLTPPVAAFPPAVDLAVRQGAQRSEGAPGPDLGDAPQSRPDDAADGPFELPDRADERRGRLPEAREADARRTRTPSIQLGQAAAGGRRHEGRDRGVQGVPEARARDDGPARAPVRSASALKQR